MAFQVIFRRELRDTVLSRRFLIYLALILLPVVVGAGFSYAVHRDPSTLTTMTSMLPEPITQVTPAICMMIYMDIATLSVVLVAILHSADFIAGEQARGTLQLLVSKPVRRWQIILGKYSSFLVIFIPLIFASVALMSLSLPLMGIGPVSLNVFLGYFAYLFAMGIVYISLATLFSAIARRTLTAVLATFILMIVWIMFDFIIIYLPESIANVLNNFSLSFYANNILGYISGGTAALFVVGGVPSQVLLSDYLQSWGVIFALLVLPVIVAMLVLQQRDIL